MDNMTNVPNGEGGIRRAEKLSVGKRIGWFALGFTPILSVFMWQIFAVSILMTIYMVYRMLDPVFQSLENGSSEYNLAVEGITNDFMQGTSMNITTFITYLGYIVIFGIWYYFMFCRKKQTGSWKLVLKPHRIGAIIGAGISLQIAIDMGLCIILPLVPKINEKYNSIMEELGAESIFMIFAVCILAPIAEELVFRGLTYRILKKAVPWQIAMVIQALLFGIYHLNITQAIYATMIGLALGYLAYKYESVIPGMLLHMAINSSSYLVEYLLPDSIMEHNVIMIIIGLATTAISIVLIMIAGKVTLPQTESSSTN